MLNTRELLANAATREDAVRDALAMCQAELSAFLECPGVVGDVPGLETLVRELSSMPVEGLADERFRDAVNRLRKLHQAQVAQRVAGGGGTLLTCKVLLVVSRVTRLVEFFNSEDGLSPSAAEPQGRSREAENQGEQQGKGAAPALTVSTPVLERAAMSRRLTLPPKMMQRLLPQAASATVQAAPAASPGLPIRMATIEEESKSPLLPVVSSPRSVIADASGNLRSPRMQRSLLSRKEPSVFMYLLEKMKTFFAGTLTPPSLPPSPTGSKPGSPPRLSPLPESAQSSPIVQASAAPLGDSSSSGEPMSVLCRICEELVASDNLDEHTTCCAAIHATRNRLQSVRERLGKLAMVIPSGDQMPVALDNLRSLLLAASHCDINVPAAALSQTESIKRELDLVAQVPCGSAAAKPMLERAAPLLEELLSLLRQLSSLVSKERRTIQQTSGPPPGTQQPSPATTPSSTKSPEEKGVSISDFEFLRRIGKGAYGKVYLARKKKTGDLYAVKRLNKREALRKNQIPHIAVERNILATTNNPFLVRSYWSFQTRDNLYMVMEYAAGGDLYSLLKAVGAMDEDMARRYLAQVVLALQYLHSLGIVHRDLKPDNLLISSTGHIKLTDFGLSRYGLLDDSQASGAHMNSMFVSHPSPAHPLPSPPPSSGGDSSPATSSAQVLQSSESAGEQSTPPDGTLLKMRNRTTSVSPQRQRYSVVGTPDYLAPEVIFGTGHDKAVDFWSLGAIAFEFLTGLPPFNADTPQQIFENIISRSKLF